MLQARVQIVDRNGCPTPILLKLWNSLASDDASSLTTRVADLETDVAAIETLTTAQGASISALTADVAALEADVATLSSSLTALTTRVSDNELRAVFGATVWPS